MPERPQTTLTLLGKYLSLATLLPAGALAGYLLGKLAVHLFYHDAPGHEWLQGGGIVLGVVSSIMKLFQELMRDAKREERGNKK
jgi:hypothetical protein